MAVWEDDFNDSSLDSARFDTAVNGPGAYVVEGTEYVNISTATPTDAAVLRLKASVPTTMTPCHFVSVKAKVSSLDANQLFYYLCGRRSAAAPTNAAKATWDASNARAFWVAQRANGQFQIAMFFDGGSQSYWTGSAWTTSETWLTLGLGLGYHYVVQFWLDMELRVKISLLTGDGSKVLMETPWANGGTNWQPANPMWFVIGDPYTDVGACTASVDWVRFANEHVTEGYFAGMNDAGIYKLGRCVSFDHGRTWTPHTTGATDGLVAHTAFGGGENVTHIKDPSVLYRDEAYYMACAHFNSVTGKYSISLFTLAAGFPPESSTWSRIGAAAVIAPGGSGSPDINGCFAPLLMWDPSFPTASQRWRLYYTGLNASNQATLCVAYASSFSGTWTKDANNPILALGAGGAFDSAYVNATDYFRDAPGNLLHVFYGGGDGSSDKVRGGAAKIDMASPSLASRQQTTPCIDRLSGVSTAITTLAGGGETATVADSSSFQPKDWIVLINSAGTTFQWNRVEAIPNATTLTLSYPASVSFNGGLARHAAWGSVTPYGTSRWRYRFRSWPTVGNHRDVTGVTLAGQGYAEGEDVSGLTMDRKIGPILPLGAGTNWCSRSAHGVRPVLRPLDWRFNFPLGANASDLTYTLNLGHTIFSDGVQAIVVLERTTVPNNTLAIYTSQDGGATWFRAFTIFTGGSTSENHIVTPIGNKLYIARSIHSNNNPALLYRVDYNPSTLSFSLGVNGATIQAAEASFWHDCSYGTRFAQEPGGRLWVVVGSNESGNARYIAKYSDNDGATWTLSATLASGSGSRACAIVCLEKRTIAFVCRTSGYAAVYQYNRLHTAPVGTWTAESEAIVAGSYLESGPTWVDARPMLETPAKNGLVVSNEASGQSTGVVWGTRFAEAADGTLTWFGLANFGNIGRKALTGGWPRISARTDGWKVYYMMMMKQEVLRYRDVPVTITSWGSAPDRSIFYAKPGLNASSQLQSAPSLNQAVATDAHALALYYASPPSDTLGGMPCAMSIRVPAGPAVAIARVSTAMLDCPGGIGSPRSIPIEQLGSVSVEETLDLEARPETTLTIANDLSVEALVGVPQRRWLADYEADGMLVLAPVGAMPVEAAGVLTRLTGCEIDAVTGLDRAIEAPIEALERVGPRRGVPLEYSGAISLQRVRALQIDATARLTDLVAIPIEAAGLVVLIRTRTCAVDTRQALAISRRMDLEADGVKDGIYDEWNVYTKLSEVFLDEWTVVPMAVTVDFSDTWTVASAMGMDVIDIWRVLPQQIVTLFGQDIQLPSAAMEKD